MEIRVEKWARRFKNENAFGETALRRGDLLILSGLPLRVEKCFVTMLTQVGNGAGGLLAVDDFDGLRWCWRWAHLMFHHGLARRHAVAVFVDLPAIFDHAELLDRLDHIMVRLRR